MDVPSAGALALTFKNARLVIIPAFIAINIFPLQKFVNRSVEYPLMPWKVERRLAPLISTYPALPRWEEAQAKIRREDARKGLPQSDHGNCLPLTHERPW
ncbi:MAG TPA: hypothetical protein VEG60_07835 [Candidatus Binatia bacterium]|nr:hypothetical protein [Candidatus Binatia bacterium]